MSSDPLLVDMQVERKKWARSTIIYATLNIVFRVLLILISGIVAVQNNLNGSPIGFLVKWVPILALAVTILTAFDSWIKPRDKWRGFMEDRDDLSDLVIRAQTKSTNTVPALDDIREEFRALRRRHRNKNVY